GWPPGSRRGGGGRHLSGGGRHGRERPGPRYVNRRPLRRRFAPAPPRRAGRRLVAAPSGAASRRHLHAERGGDLSRPPPASLRAATSPPSGEETLRRFLPGLRARLRHLLVLHLDAE